MKDLTGSESADCDLDCAGIEATSNQAVHMINRGGKVGLVVFPGKPGELDVGNLAVNNIYL